MKPAHLKLSKFVLSAVLLVLAPFTLPAAQAETGLAPRRVAFTFNSADSAEKIYADLERTATRACDADHIRPLFLRALRTECVKDLLDAAVARINRPELASLHVARG